VFLSGLCYLQKAALFQAGFQASPAITVTPPVHTFSQSSCLDILNVACNQEGWGYRKTPKVGWTNDVIDVGTTFSPGGAGSSQIGTATGVRFAEGSNCDDVQLQDNAENPVAILHVNGSSAGGNGPKYLAVNPTALKKYGPFAKQVNAPDYAGFGALRRTGQLMVTNAGTPGQAKVIKVNDELTDGAWRELDTIILHWPTLGIIEQAATVIGYEVEEGSLVKTLHLDQFAATSATTQVSRLRTQIDDALGGASRATGTSLDGATTIDLQLRQGITTTDSNGNLRAVIGIQSDGKKGLRILNANGTTFQLLTGTPAAGQSTTNADWTA
jgi:hypothetical protein